MQKTNQKVFRFEKVIKGKGDKWYVKWKGYDYSVGLIKKTYYKGMHIFQKRNL